MVLTADIGAGTEAGCELWQHNCLLVLILESKLVPFFHLLVDPSSKLGAEYGEKYVHDPRSG